MEVKKEKSNLLDVTYKSLIIAVLFFYGAYRGRAVIVPMVFSIFISLILYPLITKMESKGINRVLAILIVLVLVLVVFSGAIWIVGAQADNIIVDLPALKKQFYDFIENLANKIEQYLNISTDQQMELLRTNSDSFLSSSSNFFGSAVLATSNVITFLTLVPIYVFFILLYRDNFKTFLKNLKPENNGQSFLRMFSDVKNLVQNYITGLMIVITIVAVLNSIGLLLLGIKYAILIGVLSAILTVIPYIGIAIGASIPIIVALITKDSIFYAVGVLGVYVLIQFFEGNIITPKVVGSKVKINPLAAIFALIIFGSLWGIIGMIMAIPLTGVIKILLTSDERTRPFAYLLTSETKKESMVYNETPFFKNLRTWSSGNKHKDEDAL